MPVHPALHRTATTVTLTTAAAMLLAACTGPSDPDHDTQIALEHIHGLTEDRETGGLLVASHGGIYRLDEIDRDAELTGPIAGNDFDAMGFTAVVGTLYASGHPGKNSPDHFGDRNLGLIRSDDNGDTWHNVALTGEADFHDLTISTAEPNRIYANNFGTIYRSDDGGRTWNDGTGLDAWDILADPINPNTLYATTATGLHISRDGGETFTPDTNAPAMSLITTFSDGRIVGARLDGTLMYQADSGEWTAGSEISGAVQALTTTTNDEVIVADERGVRLFTDPDATGQVLFRPEPHI
ncbi:hypothetical protein GCM10022219_06740 [Microbacterium oryzae]|uniref:Exo-alpha-sialidase n=1 Tax=Microbacterium oryzae TaxID=743009 RepID=A0A6I6DXQ1_9MICO|nr:sialidase family protein [Microbacterium oryzae]QGU26774.1 exo-alpha-sialidase [Microbacterium oryzae]